MVVGPVLVPVPVILTAITPLLTATTTDSILSNHSTNLPVDTSTPVDPAPVTTTTTATVAPELLPETTTVTFNHPTNISVELEPTITTTVPANTPTPVLPEPDTTTTTCVYDNPPTQNFP